MRVMIIDDEQHMTEYLKHLIDWPNHGFDQVEIYNRGHEAKEAILTDPPELVLTDIRMPEISGLEIAQSIYENKLPSKVVIISGYSEFSYAQTAIRFGVKGFLLKPILKQDLLETLDQVKNLLGNGSSHQLSNQTIEKGHSSEINDPAIEKIQNYVNEHYSEPLTLDTLAQLVHLNSSYLSAFYKKATGENLLVFMTDVRLAKAADLLKESNLRVNTIGEMVGYNKTQYFISLFKKKYGVTPQQFRKQ